MYDGDLSSLVYYGMQDFVRVLSLSVNTELNFQLLKCRYVTLHNVISIKTMYVIHMLHEFGGQKYWVLHTKKCVDAVHPNPCPTTPLLVAFKIEPGSL